MKSKFFSILAAGMLALFCSGQIFAQDMVYSNADAFPVFGKSVPNTTARYERLTPETAAATRPAVASLGTNSAGLYVRFRTDSRQINARWTSLYGNHMNHQTLTGTRGLDLYALLEDGTWRFVNSARPALNNRETDAKIISGMDGEMREYMLYLSLYDGVEKLEIGVEDGSVLEGPSIDSPCSGRPIVMYGTSILQGGCANRPGMAFTSILSRRFDREVVNLGFSGNALLDLEIAEQMAQIPDPAVYVLDYVPNASARMIDEKGEHFFSILREAHPEVPVIFVEDPDFTHLYFDEQIREEVRKKNLSQKALFERLKKAGVKKIFYVDNSNLIGQDGEACVDGIHFTDMGMVRMADAMMPALKKALKHCK